MTSDSGDKQELPDKHIYINTEKRNQSLLPKLLTGHFERKPGWFHVKKEREQQERGTK